MEKVRRIDGGIEMESSIPFQFRSIPFFNSNSNSNSMACNSNSNSNSGIGIGIEVNSNSNSGIDPSPVYDVIFVDCSCTCKIDIHWWVNDHEYRLPTTWCNACAYNEWSYTYKQSHIMDTMASQITSLTVVYSIVYSGADQRKHQSSASLVFVWGIHRDRWIPRTNGQ